MYRTTKSRALKLRLLIAVPIATLAMNALAQNTQAQNASGATDARTTPFQHLLQKMDTNGDGRISEQEFLAAAAARFKTIDSANTGRVDAQQMLDSPAAAQRLQHRAEHFVSRLDTAGNGYVTQDEVATAAQKRFARMDRNGDGKLTPDELTFRHGPRTAADGAPNERRAAFAQKYFDKLDANHDGVVTRDEFVAAATARFQQLDSQGTGKITAADIASSPQAQQRAQHAVARIVQRLDTNGDGAVSQDEYLAAAKKRFSRMDRNGDGFIDADEMPAHRWAHGGRAAKVDG
jgi:Ca2+-binding EF-hand superfamily protein